jgi:hypothetical protein
MSNGIDITTELTTRARLLFLTAKETRAAEVRAINKTLTGVTAQASRLIRQDLTASAKAIKESIKPTRATKTKPRAEVAFKAKGIPLDEFKPQEKAITVTRSTVSGRTKPYQVRGWTVKVQKKKPRTNVRQGFRLSKGKFLRQVSGEKRLPGKGIYAGKVARVRLQQAFGPSPAKAIEPHINALIAYTRKRLDVLLAAEIRFEEMKRRGQTTTRTRSR